MQYFNNVDANLNSFPGIIGMHFTEQNYYTAIKVCIWIVLWLIRQYVSQGEGI